MDRKIILFELNEVPYRILDEYCRLRPASRLARRLPTCRQTTTFTEDAGSLSPWFTWPSLHRGVDNRRHGIQDFGQDLAEADREFPPIWKLLSARGLKVGVGGSLHSYPLPEDAARYAFYLPDTFAAGPEASPAKLETFQAFNLTMARASGRNVDRRLPWRDALDLLAAAPSLGLRPSTFAEVVLQLARERLNPARTVRRRSYQSALSLDVFMRCLEETRPDFSTFFTNHVASAMHRYWAAAFPSDYAEFGYDDEWVRTYGSEILFAMDKADAFFGRLADFADRNPEYMVWIATSMGQAATSAVPVECQLYVTEPAHFMKAMGVAAGDYRVMPAMLPQFNVKVSTAAADPFRTKIVGLSVDGQAVGFREAGDGFFSLDFGQANLTDPARQRAAVGGATRSFSELGLANTVIEDQTGSNAYHIPDGCLIVYDPRKPMSAERGMALSTLEIAPAILRNYSVPVPGYMKAPAHHEASLA